MYHYRVKMMSQQVLKPQSPSALLGAPRVQRARVFTAHQRQLRGARFLVRSAKTQEGGSSDDKAAVTSGERAADHPTQYSLHALMLYDYFATMSPPSRSLSGDIWKLREELSKGFVCLSCKQSH